jgi:sugar/nucleoside kinase (ribokinase family)
MKSVLGIGNALVDVLVQLKDDSFLEANNLPKGSMQLVDKTAVDNLIRQIAHAGAKQTSGGSAANTMHGLAGLGCKSGYIGKVGNDYRGNLFENDLRQSKVNPTLLKSSTDTGVALSMISTDSERTFATFLGAAVELSAEDLLPQHFEGYDYLHLEGYLIFNKPLVEKALEIAKSKNMKVSLDLASYNVVEANREYLLDLIEKSVDIVFANEMEAKALTGLEPEQAVEKISSISEIAIVKIGSQGSLIKSGDISFKAEPIVAKAIDTTGAGDLYASGFLNGLCCDWPLEKCARLASFTAGKVVESIGAKISFNGWDELAHFMLTLR